MKRTFYIFIFSLVVIISSCSIGDDKKRFTCTKWETSYNNSAYANTLNSITSSALGSEATFEFYDTQIKMNFMGENIVFTKGSNGSYIYENPYYYDVHSGKVRYLLYPRKGMGNNFVTSIDLYFFVDNKRVGEASFSRDF